MNASTIALYSLVVLMFLMLLAIVELRKLFDKIEGKVNYQSLVLIIAFFGLLCVVFSLFAPSILVDLKIKKPDNEFMSPNEIGDMIGGTMGPFVGMSAVVFTFLAFYMQKSANEDIRKQFKEQQFESQFYEMLRLHKENVTEIEVVARDVNISKKESEEINIEGSLSILKHNFKLSKANDLNNLKVFRGREAFRIMKNEFEIYYSEARTIKQNDITSNDFEDAYELFFWGVRAYTRQDKRNLWEKFEPEEFINKLQLRIEILMNEENTVDPLNDFFNHETLKEVVLGNGYSSHLGHYYRHLYHTVKFVVENESLTYKQQRNYLKILRGQLSNYEQIMLFYNWLGGYGGEWEDEKNNYFTKYKMLHNLWYTELNLDEYIKEKLYELVKKYEALKIMDIEVKELEEKKSLFEGGDKVILDFFE